MAEKKRKIAMLGHQVDVTEVPIVEQEERFIQYKLEDGTVLKVKYVATSALRFDEQFLPDGTPIYGVLSVPVISVESSPLTKDMAQMVKAAEAEKAN